MWSDDGTEASAEPVTPDTEPRLIGYWPGGHLSRLLPEGSVVTIGRGETCDVRLDHGSISRLHARLTVANGAIAIEDLGSSNGTTVAGRRLAAREKVTVPYLTSLELGSVTFMVRPPSLAPSVPETLLDRIAESNISVLVLGETGSGKGVYAERVHRASKRAEKPFLPINCGALAESVLEAELFGHEKGAFTGAVATKAGLVETAHGGTVFLDEVGELPSTTQVKLLRVLENREILRVGGRKPIAVDVRFISATNRDLAELVEKGEFRQDLYFRLNGITVRVPSLRERQGELGVLAARFLAEGAAASGRRPPVLAEAALARMRAHPWPGNIRELKNVMDRALVYARGQSIEPEHLQLDPVSESRTTLSQAPSPTAPTAATAPADDEHRLILDALARAGGNQTRAAAALGISRRTLLRRLDQYEVPRPKK